MELEQAIDSGYVKLEVIFADGTHIKSNANNFILGTVVAPGNVHDSVMFDSIYKQVTERFSEIEVVTADAVYKTPWKYVE